MRVFERKNGIYVACDKTFYWEMMKLSLNVKEKKNGCTSNEKLKKNDEREGEIKVIALIIN